MDKTGLTIDMFFKNYKDICGKIGEKERNGGNAKKAHIKEIERFIKLEKAEKGNGYYLREVYKEPLIRDDQKTVYSDYVQKLILDLLVQQMENGTNKIYLSTGKFLESIYLVNKNYALCQNHVYELAELLNIDDDNIYEFYFSSHSSLQKVLESGLNQLSSKALVSWLPVVIVSVYEQKENIFTGIMEGTTIHRTATDNERELILICEKEILEQMEYKTKRSVLLARQWKSYIKKVNELLHNRSNIDYYYKGYDVVFTSKVREEQIIMNNYLMEKEQRTTEQKQLNNTVAHKLHNNAIDRVDKTKEKGYMKIGKQNYNSIGEMRVNKDYMNNIDRLIDVLIRFNSKCIEGEIVDIKNKNIEERKKKEKLTKNNDDIFKGKEC